jgi:hypothetical protein
VKRVSGRAERERGRALKVACSFTMAISSTCAIKASRIRRRKMTPRSRDCRHAAHSAASSEPLTAAKGVGASSDIRRVRRPSAVFLESVNGKRQSFPGEWRRELQAPRTCSLVTARFSRTKAQNCARKTCVRQQRWMRLAARRSRFACLASDLPWSVGTRHWSPI